MPATPVPSVRYPGRAPTHATSGLSGYPAVDIMAPGGTVVVAPEDGFVYRVSGRPPSAGTRGSVFGYSLYLKGRSGADYFLTHLGAYAPQIRGVTSSNPVRVRQGQPIGSVGNWPGNPGRSHLHMGVQGANAGIIANTPQGSSGGTGGGGGITGKVGGAIKGVGSISGVDIIEGITGKDLPDIDKDPTDVITAPLDAIRWLGGNWDRIGYVLAGFILLLVGLILMGRSVGLAGTRRIGGDLMNRLEYGPVIVQARRERMPRTQLTEDMGRPPTKSKYAAVAADDDIPF